jgi:hypothetical protein
MKEVEAQKDTHAPFDSAKLVCTHICRECPSSNLYCVGERVFKLLKQRRLLLTITHQIEFWMLLAYFQIRMVLSLNFLEKEAFCNVGPRGLVAQSGRSGGLEGMGAGGARRPG